LETNSKEVFRLNPHHNGINVKDIDSSIAWYRNILGFELIARDLLPGRPRMAFLKSGDFYIELFEAKNAPPLPESQLQVYSGIDETIGIKQVAFTVDDPIGFTEMLKRNGVNITKARADGTAQFIRDNSGNVLEFMPPGWQPPIQPH
jgi:catechol 2,3-dioxygenase-like lactoylglutathione lyase family enzyme